MGLFPGSGLKTYGIGEFMSTIKTLANNTNSAFVILAQINRGDADEKIPNRKDIKDSADIENMSDNLIALHRPEYNQIPNILNPYADPNKDEPQEIDSTNKMFMRMLKSRDYGTGDLLVHTDIGLNRFWAYDMEFGDAYWELYKKEQFWKDLFNIDELFKQLKDNDQLKIS